MKMQIHDTVITQAQLDACIARMQSEPFKAADITNVAIQAGVPRFEGYEFIAHRVADRLIQKHRKLGKIKI
jgi:zona occludens toxin (predicted ATPase)